MSRNCTSHFGLPLWLLPTVFNFLSPSYYIFCYFICPSSSQSRRKTHIRHYYSHSENSRNGAKFIVESSFLLCFVLLLFVYLFIYFETWLQICKAILKIMVSPEISPKSWYYRHTPPHLVLMLFLSFF